MPSVFASGVLVVSSRSFVLMLAWCSCGALPEAPDAGPLVRDAGEVLFDGGTVVVDAGSEVDAGAPLDAGFEADAGLADAGVADAGLRLDAGVDAGSPPRDAGFSADAVFKFRLSTRRDRRSEAAWRARLNSPPRATPGMLTMTSAVVTGAGDSMTGRSSTNS